MCVCVCVCVYTHIYTCTRTHTHTHIYRVNPPPPISCSAVGLMPADRASPRRCIYDIYIYICIYIYIDQKIAIYAPSNAHTRLPI